MAHTTTVINMYTSRGFRVVNVHADKEFDCIKGDIKPIEMNIMGADEHVHEAERSIRTTKDRIRSTIHGLPYKRYPKLMMIKLVGTTMHELNQVPNMNGISDSMSPITIVTGQQMVNYRDLKASYGAYAQVHESNDIANNTHPRTVGAIALGISPNRSGYYEFMNLNTGKLLSRKRFTILPITDAVIQRVEQLAEEEKQPKIINGCPKFEWNPDDEIVFDDDDDDDEQQTGIDNSDEAMDELMTDTAEVKIIFGDKETF